MPTPINGTGEFAIKLMEVFGLTGQWVKSINIHTEANSIVTIDITRYISDSEAKNLTKLLTQYELHKKKKLKTKKQ